MASPALSHTYVGSERQQVVYWLLDTRKLWPGESILKADGAAEAIALVSAAEQNIITGMMFARDARMSLASALLKRAFISYSLGMAWRDVRIARRGDKVHGKPCAVDASGEPISGLDFNISHSGGLVALVGFYAAQHSSNKSSDKSANGFSASSQAEPTPEVLVGVDIVCVNEQDHFKTIRAEGWEAWMDMYEDIFAPSDLWIMKNEIDWIRLEDGSFLTLDDIGRLERCADLDKEVVIHVQDGREVCLNTSLIVSSKLRRFHANFCYKEAYVKLSGEALLAPWIKQLEFANVRSPKPASKAWGEEIDDVGIYLQGRAVSNVRMKIYAFEEDYMIAVGLQGNVQHIEMSGFRMLDLEHDILRLARR